MCGRVAVVLASALAIACSERTGPAAELAADERWQPIHRFVETDGENPAEVAPATATIGDETRPVLRSAEPFTLNYSPKYAVPASGRATLRPPLPEGLEAEQLLVEIRVRTADRWVALPGRLLEPYFGRGKRRVDVELDLANAPGPTVGIWVTARRPQAGAVTIETLEARSVPERSRLAFAIGVADVAAAQGPVEFGLSACEVGTPERCTDLFAERVDASQPGARGWSDRSVPLEAVEGRDVTFRFVTRAVGDDGGAEGHTLAFWADPTLLAPAGRDTDTPSLILISLDTLRADHVGAYGYPRDTTPFIDSKLAEGGTLFERYVAAASSTRPSHMTMFTSLPPSVHGATENAGIRTLPAGATTLAELLRADGFATGAITENGAIDRSRGFGRGFGTYVENRDSQSADMRTGHIEQTFENGLAWLDEHPGERFFLFLHTYQVHNPFTPPPTYDDFFNDALPELEPPPALREDWDPLLYDREIRYTDDRVRELVSALDARGLLEDTLLVLTADHGEAFLEHGFVAHGANVHAEVLHVPLIFYGPGVPAGRRITTPVPMLDLMPTLLELVSVAPSGQEMGRSQAEVVRGGPEPSNGALRPIYAEAWATRAVRARGVDEIPQPTLSLQLGHRKLIRSRSADGFRYELYDTRRDPNEEVDLYGSERADAEDLREMLDRYEQRTHTLHEQLGQLPADAPTLGPPPALDPVLEEKLRALGYID